MIKNIVYFLYFFKQTNWKKLTKDLTYVSRKCDISKIRLLKELFSSSLKFGSSFHEYFYFGFYMKEENVQEEYATMGFMRDYHKKNNPFEKRFLLEDKKVFLEEYGLFIGRNWLDVSKSNKSKISDFVNGKDKIVLKKSRGVAGRDIKVIDLREISIESLMRLIKKKKFDLVEDFIRQHPDLMNLSPNSVNTIRVITQIDKKGKPVILGAILRMGIYKNTDNMSTGGIASKVNINTGIVAGPGTSFDISLPDCYTHPVTKKEIVGFAIPYWDEVTDLCKKAALVHPENKSVGWDVAINEHKPVLIEGNHNWGARLWQIPEKEGKKNVLMNYV